MKIVHLITDVGVGGAQSMLLKLIGGMDRSRFENVVISMTGPGSIGAQMEAAGIRVLDLGMTRRRVEIDGLFRLRRMLIDERPDVLQTWLYHADLLGTLANLIGPRAPLLWNIRSAEMEAKHYSRLFAFIRRLLGLLSFVPRAIVVNSRSGLAIHEEYGYSPSRWVVIPNGFRTDQFRPRTGERVEDGDAPVVGHVARYDPMKGHVDFLEAAAMVRERVPSARFLLAGPGVVRDNEELWSNVVRLELDGAVTLLGEIADTTTLYPRFDVFCLSSAFGEAFPNVLGEAMSCGIPCVATDVGDSAAIVGDTGTIIPPRDPKALAAALIAKLELPPPVRDHQGALARQRIEELYSLGTVIRQYEQLYEATAAEKPH